MIQWFKDKQRIIKENTILKKTIQELGVVIDSLYKSLGYVGRETDAMKEDMYVILGAIALQHNGEMTIRDDMIRMIKSKEYNMQVSIKRNEENNGNVVRVIEVKEEKVNDQ